MVKNRIIARCRVFNQQGEGVELCIRECKHVRTEYAVFVSEGFFSNGTDLKWVQDLHSALQIVAAEAELVALS